MKKIIFAILIVILVVLVGTWPLGILSKLFEYIGIALNWLAGLIDFFGWNGLV